MYSHSQTMCVHYMCTHIIYHICSVVCVCVRAQNVLGGISALCAIRGFGNLWWWLQWAWYSIAICFTCCDCIFCHLHRDVAALAVSAHIYKRAIIVIKSGQHGSYLLTSAPQRRKRLCGYFYRWVHTNIRRALAKHGQSIGRYVGTHNVLVARKWSKNISTR